MFLRKLLITGFSSIIAAVFLISNLALAVDVADIFKNTTPCVDTEGADKGKLIQVIEEKFGDIQNSADQDGYEVRDCARNILQYSLNGKIMIHSRLLKTCHEGADTYAIANANGELRTKFTCQQVQVIVGGGGTSFLYGYVSTIYRWAAGLVGIIAVTIIVFSGIQITLSGGEPDTISKAKGRIIKSLSGIAVLFLSALILNTVNPNFFTS